MRIICLATATALLLTTAVTSQAQEVDIGPNKDDAAACAAIVKTAGDTWTGWQRDFGNGYGDSQRFYDGRYTDEPSVAVSTTAIDAVVWDETTWCYRGDGSLSTIEISTSGPAFSNGEEVPGMSMTRRGFLYFDDLGNLLQTVGYNADSEGAQLSALSDDEYTLGRPCAPIDPKVSVSSVVTQVDSVLGDIEGTRADYAPEELDWCAVAVAPAAP